MLRKSPYCEVQRSLLVVCKPDANLSNSLIPPSRDGYGFVSLQLAQIAIAIYNTNSSIAQQLRKMGRNHSSKTNGMKRSRSQTIREAGPPYQARSWIETSLTQFAFGVDRGGSFSSQILDGGVNIISYCSDPADRRRHLFHGSFYTHDTTTCTSAGLDVEF